jgi:hypothetical protein
MYFTEVFHGNERMSGLLEKTVCVPIWVVMDLIMIGRITKSSERFILPSA